MIQLSKYGRTDNLFSKCTLDIGKGVCNKSYLRYPERIEIGKQLMNGISVDALLANQANTLMTKKGCKEHPNIRKPVVLYKVKSEYKRSHYIHDDPLQALLILKNGENRNEIDGIGLSPAFVRYCTSDQIDMYKKISAMESTHISIDSTGSVVDDIMGRKYSCTWRRSTIQVVNFL